MISLNLGCGRDYKQGYLNIDKNKQVKPDLVLDLNQGLKKIKSNSCKEVLSYHNLEHLDNWELLLREIHRVLIPDGILRLKVPHSGIYLNPYHKQHFDRGFIYYYNYYNQDRAYKELSFRFNYSTQFPHISKVVNIFLNLHTKLTNRTLSWIGIEEMEFTLQSRKKGDIS